VYKDWNWFEHELCLKQIIRYLDGENWNR
jgi:hypothetical protein